MKSLLLVGILFGALTASALEVPNAINCLFFRGDLAERNSNMAPESINFSHEELSRPDAPKSLGQYEGINLGLRIVLPNEQWGDYNIQVILSEESESGMSHLTLMSSHMEDKKTTVMYRKPGASHYVAINCTAQ